MPDSKYPHAYDDDETLLPIIPDRKTFHVESTIAGDDTEILIIEPVTGMVTPFYAIFKSGEIAYISEVNTSHNSFVVARLEDRGVIGTKIQIHGANEELVIGFLSAHHNALKSAAINAQVYHGLVGREADRPVTCLPGMRYVAYDTGKVYYCHHVDNWMLGNLAEHAVMAGTSLDSHLQYHDDSRGAAWHNNQPGGHIAGGDDHNHFGEGQGSGIIRIRAGLDTAKPATPHRGEVYFATDAASGEGMLYLAIVYGSWSPITGIPMGGIVAFNGPCPPGWTRFTALDGHIPVGSSVAGAGTVKGQATHKHTYKQMWAHNHTVGAINTNTSSAGGHSHGVTLGANSGTGAGGVNPARTTAATDNSGTTSSDGGHSHEINLSERQTDYAFPTAETDERTSLPVSRQLVFCRKD